MNDKSRAYAIFSLWLLKYKKSLTALDILCNAVIFTYQAVVAYCIRQILNLLDSPSGNALPAALPWLMGIVVISLVRIIAIQSSSRLDARRDYCNNSRVRGRLLGALLSRRDVTEVSGQSGALFEVLDDDVPAATFPAQLLTEVTGHFIFTIISLCMLISINWRLTLFIFVPLSAAIFGVGRLSQRIKDRRRVSREAHGAASTFIGDVAAAAVSIRAADAAHAVLNRLDGVNAARRKAVISDVKLGAQVSFLLDSSVCVGSAVMMYIAARLLAGAQFGIGDFSLFIVHLGTLANCALRISELVTECKKAEVSLERISSAFGGDIWTDTNMVAIASSDPPESDLLAAQDITYTYNGKGGFRNVSFTVGPGEMLAVAGGMASGKSTLLSVIMGLMPPQSGHIRVRGGIAGAPRHGGFFADSLRDNLCLGMPADDAHMENAIEIAQLCDVAHTSEGLSRNIGDQGSRLSGGQRQRLAIARAIMREASVCVLDDCVSGLDAETRAHVINNLRDFVNNTGRALIIATNSREVLRAANRILFMYPGHAAQIGTYDELARACPVFSAVVSAEQQISYEG